MLEIEVTIQKSLQVRRRISLQHDSGNRDCTCLTQAVVKILHEQYHLLLKMLEVYFYVDIQGGWFAIVVVDEEQSSLF